MQQWMPGRKRVRRNVKFKITPQISFQFALFVFSLQTLQSSIGMALFSSSFFPSSIRPVSYWRNKFAKATAVIYFNQFPREHILRICILNWNIGTVRRSLDELPFLMSLTWPKEIENSSRNGDLSFNRDQSDNHKIYFVSKPKVPESIFFIPNSP